MIALTPPADAPTSITLHRFMMFVTARTAHDRQIVVVTGLQPSAAGLPPSTPANAGLSALRYRRPSRN